MSKMKNYTVDIDINLKLKQKIKIVHMPFNYASNC